ncbi:diacylglycerol kinase family lipid kinase [Candidatus Poribacteria bacterium]|nr:diacylglycerol kinase family lipid kinase [Candidatus Poribacteria bacterium]
MSPDLHLIYNPAAGKGRSSHEVQTACAELECAGAQVTVLRTEAPGHATTLARRAAESGIRTVVAFGGDGTAREVAAGLHGSGSRLGVLPAGTGNDLARSLGIPSKLPDAVTVVVGGAELAIDLGSDSDGLFTGVCGVGFAAEVAYEANRFHWIHGSPAYFAGVFRALMRLRPVPMRIYLDDDVVEHSAVFVMAQNTPYCGGGQWMAPQASLTDGKLDVVVVSEISRIELVRTFPKVYSGEHVTHPAFHVYRSSTVRVESQEPLRKMLDGDHVQPTPMDVRTLPAALKVLVPPGTAV